MRYGVDTSELWVLAATADDAAAALDDALGALSHVIDSGIGTWCQHPAAAAATHTAVAALQERAAAARACAAALSGQLVRAAQGYVDVDTPGPR